MGRRRFQRASAGVGEAARAVAASALVAPTPGALRRIRAILRNRLRSVDGGRLVEPAREGPVGLLIWRVGS